MEKITAHEMLKTVLNSSGGWLLIGATRSGRGLYKALEKQGKEKLISVWTEKKYNFFKLCKLPMKSPDAITKEKISGIILSSDFVEKCYYQFCDTYHLESLPVYEMYGEADDFPDFEWIDPKYTDTDLNEYELISINPLQLINEKRLDIVIRYIACKEILNGISSDGIDMYNKLTFSMNDGEEFVRPFTTCSFFSDYKEKKGTSNFIGDLSKLISSMKENGFSAKHFIPLSQNYGVINGTHRVATALALGINVYARVFVGFGEPFLSFDKNDLKRIGCSDEQIALVEKEYKTLKNKECTK